MTRLCAVLAVIVALFVPVAAQAASPTGYVDGMYQDEVSHEPCMTGWTFDPDDTATGIEYHVYVVGGNGYARNYTSLIRGDVNAAYSISGVHGFCWIIPSELRDGKTYSVHIFGIDSVGGDTNSLLGGSPKSFQIATPTPTATPTATPTPTPTVSPTPYPTPTPASLIIKGYIVNENGERPGWGRGWATVTRYNSHDQRRDYLGSGSTNDQGEFRVESGPFLTPGEYLLEVSAVYCQSKRITFWVGTPVHFQDVGEIQVKNDAQGFHIIGGDRITSRGHEVFWEVRYTGFRPGPPLTPALSITTFVGGPSKTHAWGYWAIVQPDPLPNSAGIWLNKVTIPRSIPKGSGFCGSAKIARSDDPFVFLVMDGVNFCVTTGVEGSFQVN